MTNHISAAASGHVAGLLDRGTRRCFWEGASCELSSNSEVKYLSGALDETQPCHSPHSSACHGLYERCSYQDNDLTCDGCRHCTQTKPSKPREEKLKGKMDSWRQHVVNFFCVCNMSRVCGASGGFGELLRMLLQHILIALHMHHFMQHIKGVNKLLYIQSHVGVGGWEYQQAYLLRRSKRVLYFACRRSQLQRKDGDLDLMKRFKQ